MMTGRLIIAIFSTILEEAAICFGILWGLPKLGLDLLHGLPLVQPADQRLEGLLSLAVVVDMLAHPSIL